MGIGNRKGSVVALLGHKGVPLCVYVRILVSLIARLILEAAPSPFLHSLGCRTVHRSRYTFREYNHVKHWHQQTCAVVMKNGSAAISKSWYTISPKMHCGIVLPLEMLLLVVQTFGTTRRIAALLSSPFLHHMKLLQQMVFCLLLSCGNTYPSSPWTQSKAERGYVATSFLSARRP